MPDIKLDTVTNDLLIVGNDMELTKTEDESLAQRLVVKLRTFRGEWYLDSTVGVPYFTDVFGKGRSLQAIEALFQDMILEEPEVQQIVSFSSSLDKSNRLLGLSFQVRSDSDAELIPIELQI